MIQPGIVASQFAGSEYKVVSSGAPVTGAQTLYYDGPNQFYVYGTYGGNTRLHLFSMASDDLSTAVFQQNFNVGNLSGLNKTAVPDMIACSKLTTTLFSVAHANIGTTPNTDNYAIPYTMSPTNNDVYARMSKDGKYLFTLHRPYNQETVLRRHTLGTNWDLSTVGAEDWFVNFSLLSANNWARGIDFTADGLICFFTIHNSTSSIYRLYIVEPGAAFDPRTFTQIQTMDFSTGINDVNCTPDGKTLLVSADGEMKILKR